MGIICPLLTLPWRIVIILSVGLLSPKGGYDMRKLLIKSILTLAMVLSFVLIPSVKSEAAVKTMPDGGRFDPSFYAATYPDVYAAFGMNETLLYQHYKLFGIKENRLPYAEYDPNDFLVPASESATLITMPDGNLFDPVFYANKYPDVRAVFGNNPYMLYSHYILCGIYEGRLPYEGSAKSDLKLTFSSVGAIANANTREDVVSALRQAAQFRVTKLTILTTWNGTLSAESIKTLIGGQSTFIKTTYGATMTVTDQIIYGSAQNPTIETDVTLRFR